MLTLFASQSGFFQWRYYGVLLVMIATCFISGTKNLGKSKNLKLIIHFFLWIFFKPLIFTQLNFHIGRLVWLKWCYLNEAIA